MSASDGGRDCRTHNNNVRLDTSAARDWIETAIEDQADDGR